MTSTGFLDSRYTVAWHSQRSADGVGAALASRWPLGEVAEVDLHVTDHFGLVADLEEPRGCLTAG